MQLPDRVVAFLSYLTNHGKNMGKSIEIYNLAIPSLQSRLMPSLRRFKELTSESKELPEEEPIDTLARRPETSEIRKTPRLPEVPEED